jgi:hypothetical protein
MCICSYLTSSGAEARDFRPKGAHRTIGRQEESPGQLPGYFS